MIRYAVILCGLWAWGCADGAAPGGETDGPPLDAGGLDVGPGPDRGGTDSSLPPDAIVTVDAMPDAIMTVDAMPDAIVTIDAMPDAMPPDAAWPAPGVGTHAGGATLRSERFRLRLSIAGSTPAAAAESPRFRARIGVGAPRTAPGGAP